MSRENVNAIQCISLNRVKEFISGMHNKDKIIVFDNFDKPNQYIGFLKYPVKFHFSLSIFLLEGAMSIRIGHEEYMIKPNDWVTITTDKIYQSLYISSDAKIAICCISDGFYDFNPEKTKAIDLYNRFALTPVISLSKDSAAEYVDAYLHLKKYIYKRDHSCRTEMLKGYCNVIFLVLCGEIFKNNYLEKRRFTRKEAIYHEFIQNIEKHYKKERSVKFYADKMCLTPKYLSSVIHQMSNKHASEWIDSHTILEIKALLKTTNMPVQQIAYELNFSTPAHFGKFFKRLTGTSPKQYRHAL